MELSAGSVSLEIEDFEQLLILRQKELLELQQQDYQHCHVDIIGICFLYYDGSKTPTFN